MDRRQAVRTVMLSDANKPFEYGVLDCCLFAAKVAENITGIDYSKEFENYNEDKAAEYISDAGSLSNLVSEILGRNPVSPDCLTVGDPALVKLPVVGDAVGVVSNQSVIVKTNRGALKINFDRVIHGWKLDA